MPEHSDSIKVRLEHLTSSHVTMLYLQPTMTKRRIMGWVIIHDHSPYLMPTTRLTGRFVHLTHAILSVLATVSAQPPARREDKSKLNVESNLTQIAMNPMMRTQGGGRLGNRPLTTLLNLKRLRLTTRSLIMRVQGLGRSVPPVIQKTTTKNRNQPKLATIPTHGPN